MIRKHWLTITGLFLAFISILVSCVSEDITGGRIIQPDAKERYIKLELNLPNFVEPTSKSSTRAMGKDEERAIDLEALHILVFDTTEDTLMYKAPIVPNSLIVNGNKATVTVKMVKSENPINFTILTLANYDLDAGLIKAGITLKEAETKLAELNSKLTFSMPGEKGEDKWNTGSDTNPYTRFPMWGQKSMLGSITEQEAALLELKMYRALARIDVGLNFNPDNETGSFLESATGLDNFKLEKIYIYKTYNQGYLERKEKKDKSGELKPSADVPTNAKRNESPLVYTLGETEIESNCYVREIYVPEAQESTKDSEVHCIVVGGYYEGSSTLSYYRLDFAERDIQDQTKITRLPILRNHRYIFNIKGVKYAGSTSADNAFKDGFNPSSENFVYDLIVWDEDIHEMHVHGKYHFGLDSRDIVLKGKPSILKDESGNPLTEKTGNFKKIVYQTNYPLSESDTIAFEWENPIDPATPSVSEYFNVVWDKNITGKGILTLTALESNLTGNDITDVLTVKAGTFDVKVNVTQKSINFNYTLDCGSLFVHGVYKAGEPLNSEKNYITVNLIAEDKSIEGEEYELWVEQPIKDELGQDINISFKGKGKFKFENNIKEGDPLIVEARLNIEEGEQIIKKYKENPPIPIIVKSNSPLGSQCQIEIIPVFSYTMILVADGTNKAVNINSEQTAPYKIINTPTNFGPNHNSLVKIDKFNYINFDNKFDANEGKGQPTISGSNSDAEKWIKGGVNGTLALGQRKGEIADIVYLSYNTAINEADAEMYAEYMKKGGVILLFLEYAPQILNFMNATIGNMTLGGLDRRGNETLGVHGGKTFYDDTGGKTQEKGFQGDLIPFIANEKIAEGNQETLLASYESDIILNGPFGDIRTKQWGNDNMLLARIPKEYIEGKAGITIYSYLNRWKWRDYLANKSTTNTNMNKHTVDFVTDNTYVTSFKYETPEYNFVWFGDAGFMSSGFDGQNNAIVSEYREDPNNWSDEKQGYRTRGLEPFAWDSYFYPRPKIFTTGRDRSGDLVGSTDSPGLAYNSVAFCNIFAWAIKKADELREKREGFIEKNK